MSVYDISASALKALSEVHRFDYKWPEDLDTPLFPVRRAVLDHDGRILAAGALKVEAEAYLWVDREAAHPQTLYAAIQELHEDIKKRALKIGFDQVHAALPPEVENQMGRILTDFGWQKARPWPLYVFQVR